MDDGRPSNEIGTAGAMALAPAYFSSETPILQVFFANEVEAFKIF